MPSTGSPPLVAVAIMSRTGLPGDAKWEEAQERARKLAKGWIAKRQATPGAHKTRDVIWTWIEGDKWAGWARSMYDVKRGAVDGPKLILSDPTVCSLDIDDRSSVADLRYTDPHLLEDLAFWRASRL